MVRSVMSLLFVALLPTVLGAAPVPAPAPRALLGAVHEVEGRPVVHRAGVALELVPGMLLYAGERVTVGLGGMVSLAAVDGSLRGVDDGRLPDLAAGLPARFMDWERIPEAGTLLADFFRRGLDPYDSATLRAMQAADPGFAQVAPCNSFLLDLPVTFEWKSNGEVNRFAVTVWEEDQGAGSARAMSTREFSGAWRFRDDVRYQANQAYSWTVRGWNGSRWLESGKCYFRIVDNRTRERVRERIVLLERMKKDKPRDLVPYAIAALLLMKEKLYHDALAELGTAIRDHGGTPFPYQLRARVYEEMNLKHLAAADWIMARKLEGRS